MAEIFDDYFNPISVKEGIISFQEKVNAQEHKGNNQYGSFIKVVYNVIHGIEVV